MAKYLLAPSIDRPLGAVGGSVFQKIGTSFVIRHRSVPTDKKRIPQFIQRNRFDSIQKRFRGLSGTDQQTWRDESVNYPRINSLGDMYVISGANLQQSSNTFAFVSDVPFINSIPSPVSVPSFIFDTIEFAEPLDAFDIVLDPITVPAGFNLLVYATRPLSPGTLTPSTTYRLLGTLAPGTNTAAVNWFDQYITNWGTVNDQIGQLIFVTAQLLSIDTFQPGVTVYGSGLVTS